MPKIDFSQKGENTYFKTHNRLFFGYFFNRRPIWEPLILSHCSLQPKINTHFKHNFVTCNIFRVPCKRGSMCPGRWIFLKVQRHHKVKRHFVRLFTSSHQPDKTIVKVFKKFSGVYDRNFGGTWSGI